MIDTLAASIAAGTRDKAFVARLKAIGVEPLGDTPAEFAAKIVTDNTLWAAAVKDSGAVLQ